MKKQKPTQTKADNWSNESMADYLAVIVQQIRDKKIDVCRYHFHKDPDHQFADRHLMIEYRFINTEKENQQ